MELKQETIFEIGKFCILWAQFENGPCENDCCSNKIWEFANKNSVNIDILNQFLDIMCKRARKENSSCEEYIDSIVPKQGQKHRPTEKDIDTMKKFLNKKTEDKLAGALLIIYRIRNNLLHGKKVGLDDQKEMFKSINTVLEDILGELKCKN